ncbi:hypothetical protein [Pseudomonas sp. PDM20]|jgi:hypothetical protein|uniref:hypothetical protein n=1 Tax=Pseudomonas sp. PDM20 TaxID=2769254 RepID=UPI00177B49CD|nr:hypothetical protein [Pseudomonas sp. PDM20]MBD9686577.1 hypothetical protein [Pseudomonas sp. PDM20]
MSDPDGTNSMGEKQHAEYIDDVMIDFSQSSYWRIKLFQAQYGEQFLISNESAETLPEPLREAFRKHNLRYYVSKVADCPDTFLEGSVIFKFEASEHPALVRYSGNFQTRSDILH